MTTPPKAPTVGPVPNFALGPRAVQAVNVGLFMAALTVLGSFVVANFVNRSSEPEVSLEENRTLAPTPEWSGQALVDGSFATGVDKWIADHFAARERFMDANFWLEDHRGFRADEEGIELYAVEIDTDAELEPISDDGVMLELELEPIPGEPIDADDELEDDSEDPSEPSSISKVKGILVVDGRAMQLFVGPPRGSSRYAKAVNRYADKLRGKVQVYSLIVPTAQTFYLPASYQGRVRHEPPNINSTYAMMDESVKTVDVVASLADHTDEYIYFRTDHHWTGLGAYYAYVGFCATAGLTPTPIESLERKSIAPFRGSLYRYTRNEKLRGTPDEVEYWLPANEVVVTRGSNGSREGTLLREESDGYGVFLGGDHPVLVARTTNTTGRRALLIKNSYGNPFATFLVGQFDTVVVVDYRKFDGRVLDLIEDHQITDLIILNGAITSNAKFHIARLAHILEG